MKTKKVKDTKIVAQSESNSFAPAHSIKLVSINGTERGRRHLLGPVKASDIRQQLKAAGLKGNDLNDRINSILAGESTFREQMALAFVCDQARKGLVWDTADEIKSGAILRAVKPKAVKAKPAPSLDEQIASMTEEQAMALVAKLSEKFGK